LTHVCGGKKEKGWVARDKSRMAMGTYDPKPEGF